MLLSGNKKNRFVNTLIVLISIFLFYQMFLAYYDNDYNAYNFYDDDYDYTYGYEYVETFENNSPSYKEYNLNDPNKSLILSQQNAGNITYLKQRVDSLETLKTKVADLSKNVTQLSKDFEQMIQAQSNIASKNLPSSPPEITGAV